MVILYCLMEFEVVRFNELKRYLKNISDKTLSNNLKELEAELKAQIDQDSKLAMQLLQKMKSAKAEYDALNSAE